MQTGKQQRIAQLIIAFVTWAAVFLQFYLQIANRTTAVSEAVIRYFSYFTILTNLLVAVCFSSLLLKESKAERFFKQPTVITAVTVYILIVGLVYNLILRSQWNPQGLQLLADYMLHSITPLFALFYWIIYVPAREITRLCKNFYQCCICNGCFFYCCADVNLDWTKEKDISCLYPRYGRKFTNRYSTVSD